MASIIHRLTALAIALTALPEAVTPYVGTRDSLIVHLIGTPRAASATVGADAGCLQRRGGAVSVRLRVSGRKCQVRQADADC